MRLLLLNPNTDFRTTAVMCEVAQAAASRNVSVEGATAGFGVPLITDEAALETAAQAVAAAVEAISTRPDGVIVAAFGDPGLEAARAGLSCPVTGIAEAAMAEAGLDGRPFAVVTTTPDLVAAIGRRAALYGFGHGYVGTYVTSGDPAAVTADPERAASAFVALCHEARRDGAAAIVVGGGPLAIAARRLAATAPLPVIEPVPAAVRLAERRAAGRA